MMLMVWPTSLSATTAPSNANGMVMTTIKDERQSRRNSRTTKPVRAAPIKRLAQAQELSAERNVFRLVKLRKRSEYRSAAATGTDQDSAVHFVYHC